MNFYDTLATQFTLPLGLLSCLVIIMLVKIRMAHTDEEKGEASDSCISRANVLMYLLYPNLCRTMLTTYNCRLIEGTWLLDADLKKHCYNSEWAGNAVLAMIG